VGNRYFVRKHVPLTQLLELNNIRSFKKNFSRSAK